MPVKTLLRLLSSFILLFAISACKNSKEPSDNTAINQYISGYTSDLISRTDPIVIHFSEANPNFPNKEVLQEVLSFSPKIEGQTQWADASTIIFTPNGPLNSGTEYDAEINLKQLLNKEDAPKAFEFSFYTYSQSFDLKVLNFSAYDDKELGWNKLEGKIRAADYLEAEIVEQVLAVTQNNQKLNISWNHDLGGRDHFFTVDSVQRGVDESEVNLVWNAKDFDIDSKGEMAYKIPSLNEFSVVEASVIQKPEQHVLIIFSDPLDAKQNLNGLIQIGDYEDFTFERESNQLKVYPKDRITGVKKLKVNNSIKNTQAYPLKEYTEIELNFVALHPAVKLIGDGNILPTTDGLLLPFMAVNLKAVDLNVIKIYSNNVPQFFQVNNQDGDYQLYRVAKSVMRKKIDLSTQKNIDFSSWNTFSLDLSELIAKDPSAIYRVELSFHKSYSLYTCDEGESTPEKNFVSEDSFESHFKDDYSDYSWREADNPCHSSYFVRSRRMVSKNILASNIGLIAKMGGDQKLWVWSSEIVKNKALSDCKLEIYNRQNQKIATANTSADGSAQIAIPKDEEAFLIIARKGKDTGYLKIPDGNALSMSHFDVKGEVLQEGVKGYLYGERGVWRPGDTLFLSFILEDENDLIPAEHPVRFELRDPNGQLVERVVRSSSVNGFYTFPVATTPEAITGSYTGTVSLGSASFSKSLRVEAVKPNRLKIKLAFDDEVLSADKAVSGSINATWLHGAIAKDLKTKITLSLSPTSTSFKGYEKYHFSDPFKYYTASEEEFVEGQLNSFGEFTFSENVEVGSNAPGMMRANFVTRVFEKGGDYSIDRYSTNFSPYKAYLGVKLPESKDNSYVTDTTHTVDIVCVDEKGKAKDLKNVSVFVYKVRWRWWWDASSNGGNYVSSEHRELVHSGKVDIKNGKAKAAFKITYPSWGRFVIRVSPEADDKIASAGSVFYADWPGWVSREDRENPSGATMLAFSSDKKKYKVGEKATITIPAAKGGRALITVETGSKILKADWAESKGKEIVYKLDITPEMSPNAYVSVSFLQKHSRENSLPIRMYGSIPIFVEDPGTILKPKIKMPSELRPEQQFDVEISEENGKAMTYTLAVVEEGLLDLTRFKTPDPHSKFYAREALGVKTWDLYDHIIGAYGGTLERILSVGGDEGVSANEKKKVNRFKPVIRYMGPFELKAKGSNKHRITLPNYIGAVRTMVVAGQNSAYGNAEQSTPVKKPLMVLATLPRVLGPKEKVKVPVTVFAMDKKVKTVKVSLEANGMFNKDYEKTKTITFNETGDQVVEFELETLNKIGNGLVKVSVSGAGEEAFDQIELELRNPNPPIVKVQNLVAELGEKKTAKATPFGAEGSNQLSVELSSIPPLNLEKRLGYLLGYPHGCLEQTTSQAFPQLFIKEVLSADEKVYEKARDNVKTALNKYKTFQLYDGSFSLWPSGNYTHHWGTSYVGYFMVEAKERGFTIPLNIYQNWLKYQQQAARSYSVTRFNYGYNGQCYVREHHLMQAYRLYTLALAGKSEMGAMNRLKGVSDMDNTSKWLLAASYHLSGQQAVAAKMTANLAAEVDPYLSRNAYTYGSNTRDKALMLQAMSIMGMKEKAFSLVEYISKQLSEDRWMSTQTTGQALLAISKYLGGSELSKEVNAKITINGKVENIRSTLPLKRIALASDKTSDIVVENTGKGMLFTRITNIGCPLESNISVTNQGIKMQVTYLAMDGNEIDPSKIAQGTDFKAQIRVTNQSDIGYLADIALHQIFPSGWEILNDRMNENGGNNERKNYTYQDIRDDRVYTYFNLDRQGRDGAEKTFIVKLNAAYIGRYYLGPVVAESMYNHEITANTTGKWVEVVKPGEQTP